MSRGIPDTYSGLVTRLHENSTDIDTLSVGNNGKRSSARRSKHIDEIDSAPTVNANRIDSRENRYRNGAGKRAKWASHEEMTRRREEGLCLPCGGEGHHIAECSYRSAERPSSSRVASGQRKKDRKEDSAGNETRSATESESENE